MPSRSARRKTAPSRPAPRADAPRPATADDRRPLVRWITTHERLLLASLVLAGLAWRAGILLEIRASPYADVLTVDGQWHHRRAARIAAGEWSEGEVFFRAPLYYYLLGLLYRIFGAAPKVAQWWQVILSAATLVGIHRLARHLFGPAAALLATLLASFYGMLAYFAAGELVTVTLTLLLNTFGLWRLLAAAETRRARDVIGAGLLFGLSAVTRPDVLVFAALVPFWMTWRNPDAGRRAGLRAAAVFAAGVFLPVVPVTLHNLVVGRDLVLVASQGGVNFFIGNNPRADGVSAVVPEIQARHADFGEHVAIARAALGDPAAPPSAVSRYWSRRGLEWIRAEPAAWLALLARKAYLYWNAHEIGNNRVIGFVTGVSWLATWTAVPFWLVCPLAAVGAWLVRRRRETSLLALYVLAYFAATLLYFVNARFRMPIVPVLLILAGHAVVELARARTWPRRTVLGAALLAAGVAVLIRPYPPLRTEEIDGHYQDGLLFARAGRHDEALRHLVRAREMKPMAVATHLALGRLYLEGQGDLPRSIESFEAAIALAPGDPVPVHDLGVAYLGASRYDDAARRFARALEIDPGYVKALDNLAYCYERQGRYDEALAAYARLAAAAPRPELDAKIAQLRARKDSR